MKKIAIILLSVFILSFLWAEIKGREYQCQKQDFDDWISIDAFAMNVIVNGYQNERDWEFSLELSNIDTLHIGTIPYDILLMDNVNDRDIAIESIFNQLFDYSFYIPDCLDSAYSYIRCREPLRGNLSYTNALLATDSESYQMFQRSRLNQTSVRNAKRDRMDIVFYGDTSGLEHAKKYFTSIGHPSFIIPYYLILVEKFKKDEYRKPLYDMLCKCDTMKVRGLKDFIRKYSI